MNKFLTFLFILMIAPLIGGIYGVIHDQLTYTISPEYYTKFKFIQFGIYRWDSAENIGTETQREIKLKYPRLGATVVGFMATWWVGLFIGIVLGLLGLIHRNARCMFQITFKAFLITILVALATGLVGLFYGFYFISDTPNYWYLPEHIVYRKNFIAVGSMHNFSYLGGLLGLLVALVYSISQKITKRSKV